MKIIAFSALWLMVTVATALASEPPNPSAGVGSIAVLPLTNRSTTPADLPELGSLIRSEMADQGLVPLDPEILGDFMQRHRIRYAGGVNRQTAESLKLETGADAVLVTSLDLSYTTYPPRIGFTARLIATGEEPSILWADSAARAGDQAPGLLDLGLVSDHRKLTQRVVGQLIDSLSDWCNRNGCASASGPHRSLGHSRRFRPKVAYSSLHYNSLSDLPDTIVVLPFANTSARSDAGAIVTDQLIQSLVAAGAKVLEPGVVREVLLWTRQIYDEGPSLPQIGILDWELRPDLIIFGEVEIYEEAGSTSRPPRVNFAVRAIDSHQRQMTWNSISHSEGDSGVFFFDLGRVSTAHELSRRTADSLVFEILKSSTPIPNKARNDP